MPESQTDLRQRIKEGSNNLDDCIDLADMIGQVVRVSVETVRIVNGLPSFR